MEYILLIVGFVLIIVSSEILVDSASSIAINFKLPKSLIALTIVAFGTCAPELAISFNSIMGDNGDVALANVIGSCIINIVLVLGIAAIFKPIRIKSVTLKKELPILLITTIVFAVLLINGMVKDVPRLDRVDGIALLVTFILFCMYIYDIVKNKSKKENDDKPKYNIIMAFFLLFGSLALIMLSSEIIVENAIRVAMDLNISEKVITMFAIVIGTSLPELVMTATSARKGEFSFALGNIIGTNIFNVCIVLGLPLVLFDGISIVNFNIVDIAVIILAAIILYSFSKSDKLLSRREGICMILIFVSYYLYILMV
jgi:K+-dependent Na+/Ca+ exchanger related-protein